MALSTDAEHVLVRTKDSSLRFDVVSGSVLSGSVILEPIVDLDRLDWQIAAICKLGAMLRNAPSKQERDSRLPRLILALRALDARAEGASLRDLAKGIFSASDWPGDGENVKSRVRRLTDLAEKLQRAGPRGALAREV